MKSTKRIDYDRAFEEAREDRAGFNEPSGEHDIVYEFLRGAKLLPRDNGGQYLQIWDRRYIFEDGRCVGWYKPEG